MRIPAVIPVLSAVMVVALAFVATPCQAAGPFQYHTLNPCRLADTRPQFGGAGPLADQEERGFPVQGRCSVPTGAKAVSVNVTVVSPNGLGHLILFENGTTRPLTSNLNFPAGVPALANGAIVALGASPTAGMKIYARVAVTGGVVNVVLDVTGYFQ
jgi:hypothetical protein